MDFPSKLNSKVVVKNIPSNAVITRDDPTNLFHREESIRFGDVDICIDVDRVVVFGMKESDIRSGSYKDCGNYIRLTGTCSFVNGVEVHMK